MPICGCHLQTATSIHRILDSGEIIEEKIQNMKGERVTKDKRKKTDYGMTKETHFVIHYQQGRLIAVGTKS